MADSPSSTSTKCESCSKPAEFECIAEGVSHPVCKKHRDILWSSDGTYLTRKIIY